MNNVHFIRHDNGDAMARAVRDQVATLLRGALATAPQASLVVSGGSSPVPAYRLLAGETLPWEHVQVLLADERWVPADHADSNQRLVRVNLLAHHASAARFLPFPTAGSSAETDAAAMRRQLKSFTQLFDVVMLGMGEDGHTASLIPSAPELRQGLAADAVDCLALHPTTAPHTRLSLSMPRLLRARYILLLIQGDKKLAVFERAQRDGPVEELPVRAVLRQRAVPVDIHWSP